MKNSQILKDKRITAEEAAALIRPDEVLGTSGFTPSGSPKAIPRALAQRVREETSRGGPKFQLALCTGASVGDELDGELARAGALRKRLPYQSNDTLREQINRGTVEFVDMHLSHVAQYIRSGFVEKPTTAIIEALDVSNDGKIYLTTSGGMSASYAAVADRVLIELNTRYGDLMKGLHDVYLPKPPPYRAPIPIFEVSDRIGTPYVQVDPQKIAGIVFTDEPHSGGSFRAPDPVACAIAEHIVDFFQHEQRKGRLPRGLPFQSGVGNVANAVLSTMARHPEIGQVSMYTEVIQDSIFELIDAGKLEFASTSALTLSTPGEQRFQKELDTLRTQFVIRQQEISNNPEIIRRLGVIAMNTAVEIDIFGHVNSTHVLGSKMLNGIGGSGDFVRNANLCIYMVPSLAKQGKVSGIVPMVTHVDQNEHSVQVVVTDQGLADIRGTAPVARARMIIDRCAHPNYRDILREYLEYGLEHAPSRHTPHVLARAFELHQRLIETGSMLP